MFGCSGCGLCCQHISHVKELREYDIGNGTCRYYDSTIKGCSIYDDRPMICRVDEMYDREYHISYSKDEYYRLNADVCNSLQEKYNIDTSYRVKIGD